MNQTIFLFDLEPKRQSWALLVVEKGLNNLSVFWADTF